MIEVSRIYSVVGLLPRSQIISERPFRSPHHTTSRYALIGGGSLPSPGEVTLAHRGVLFMDEFPEFPRSTLEALRQPMEDGYVSVSRVTRSVTFPSRFLLLAASNACPCGYLGHPKKSCSCLPGSVASYKKRLSGPLLDRIDMHVHVSPVEDRFLLQSKNNSLTTKEIRLQVEQAVKIQKARFLANSRIKTNGQMSGADIKRYCVLSNRAVDLLCQAVSKLYLSARSYYKLIKVSRTIADFEGKSKIETSHLAEALQYRMMD